MYFAIQLKRKAEPTQGMRLNTSFQRKILPFPLTQKTYLEFPIISVPSNLKCTLFIAARVACCQVKFGPRVYGENLPTTLTEQTHTGEKDENNDGRYDDCEVVDKADGR